MLGRKEESSSPEEETTEMDAVYVPYLSGETVPIVQNIHMIGDLAIFRLEGERSISVQLLPRHARLLNLFLSNPSLLVKLEAVGYLTKQARGEVVSDFNQALSNADIPVLIIEKKPGLYCLSPILK